MSVTLQTSRSLPAPRKLSLMSEENKNNFIKRCALMFDHLSAKAMQEIRAIPSALAPGTFSFSNEDLSRHLYGREAMKTIDIERILRKRKLLDNENTAASKRSRKDVNLAVMLGILNENLNDELDNIEMTYSIMSFPNDVQLCVSGIPGHKFGVCSKEYMPAGTWVGPYEGKRVNKSSLKNEIANSNFCWEIYKDNKLDHFLDGSDKNSSSWMRYIRCARNQYEQNMHVVQYGPNIYYRSFKDIKSGDELLVWYEDQYEQYFGIPLYIKLSSFGAPSSRAVQYSQKQAVATQNQNQMRKSPPAYLAKNDGVTLSKQFPTNINQSRTSSIHYGGYIRQEPSCSSSPPLSASPDASPTNGKIPSNHPLEDKEIGLWKCGQCLQQFTQRSALRVHVCPHQANNPYHCGHCNMSFSDPTKLRAHVVTHNNERPFKCGFCSRTFAGATTLNNHVRTHTGQKPFICKKCGKSFSQASQMSRHQRIADDCK